MQPSSAVAARAVSLSLPVIKMTGNLSPLLARRRHTPMPDSPFKSISRITQSTSPKSSWRSIALAESNNFDLKPYTLSSRMMPVRIDGSSSTTKTELRVGKAALCKFPRYSYTRLTHDHQASYCTYVQGHSGGTRNTQ